EHQCRKAPWSALFQETNLDRTILASVPWFLQDLGTYGIGIFTPTILATLIGASIDHPRNTAELIQRDILATKGAAFIDVLLIVGIVFAVLLADRVGRIRLQIFGFIGCAVGLLLAALSLHVGGTLSGVLLFSRVYGVKLHDQYRSERDDLSDRGRGVSHFDPRGGRRLCGLLCQNRRGVDRIPVPDPAQGHRHRSSPVDLGRYQPCRCARHLALRHRNQGHQPGNHRRQGDGGGRMMRGCALAAYCIAFTPRIARASAGGATTSPSTSTILTAVSTTAALLGARLPFSRSALY